MNNILTLGFSSSDKDDAIKCNKSFNTQDLNTLLHIPLIFNIKWAQISTAQSAISLKNISLNKYHIKLRKTSALKVDFFCFLWSIIGIESPFFTHISASAYREGGSTDSPVWRLSCLFALTSRFLIWIRHCAKNIWFANIILINWQNHKWSAQQVTNCCFSNKIH